MPADRTLKNPTVLLPKMDRSTGVMKVMAKNPNTTVGIPTRISRIGLKMLRTRMLAYSDR